MLQTFDLVQLLKLFTLSLILLKTIVTLELELGPTNAIHTQSIYVEAFTAAGAAAPPPGIPIGELHVLLVTARWLVHGLSHTTT